MSATRPISRILRPSSSTPSRYLQTSTQCAATAKEGLNRHSRVLTQPKSQGASQAMLYATEGVEQDADLQKPMVGVASVW